MKIVIIGAGALGGYFGARWHEAGQDVTFLVRERRASQLKEHGLNIQSQKGDYQIGKPTIAESVSEIDEADLVLLAVKGYHLEGVLDSVENLAKKGAKILPVLNGVEHLSILQQKVGKEAVIGGLSFIISTLDWKGNIYHTSKFHDVVIGPLHSSQQETCEELARISEKANLDVKVTDEIEKALWNKYMFISAFSGITTAADLEIGKIRNHPATFRIAESILSEMQLLASKNGVNVTTEDVRKAADQLAGLDPEATSSMHQDYRKGEKLELEHLHGGALRLARRNEIRLPVTETIYGLIKPYENGSPV